MLSEALQRNAKHEARLSNISDLFPFGGNLRIVPEIESLASRTFVQCVAASLGSE
jgi:hypothetical protein